ncbi:MAG: PhzF family phenazine biosynthesis protein [Vallitaleaceae bacterium]|jgi:PhzF family phenazine biosynthesis protein|nr:PhzF family phenazine biosynthesis protein [Vallitaleaceae bacterium]
MKHTIYKVTAFSNDTQGGNPAGVVLGADSFTDEDMLKIAKEVGYSETAFVMQSESADFKVRFFTPVDEVDLCGHATVATFNLLRDLKVITIGDYTQETKAGILKLQIYNQYIYMEQNTPNFHEIIKKNEIVKCFKSQYNEYISDSPIQIVSTGLKDIILPVKNLEILLNLQPNLELIDRISRKYDVVGIHAFCLDTMHSGDAHTRNFAPRYGIDEESATGTASGALACYMTKYYKDTSRSNFIIEQGFCMKRPSKIMVKVNSIDDEIKAVFVGGSAVLI